MNQDIKTTQYLATLKNIKLSGSSRERIQSNLREYAAFHNVRDDAVGRSIGEVPMSTSLFSLKFAYMPFIILLAIMTFGGTTFAAQGSVPGDFLYPVKIGVNENIRGALAVSAESEAKLQANLLEERLEEAQKLQAKGRLTADTAATVATHISTQAKVATVASKSSSAAVSNETTTRIQLALQNFLGSTNLDSTLAAEISTSIATTDLATGLYDINAYRADMKARTEALAKVIKKHQTKLEAKVKTDLSVKVDTATKLTAEAQTQTEADARVTLDKVATLAGEVESKLSTLGQVEIDSNTGIITDIDFSVDPMSIDRGDGNSSSSNVSLTSSPVAGGSTGAGVKNNIKVKGSLDSDMIDTNVNGDTSVSGGASLNR